MLSCRKERLEKERFGTLKLNKHNGLEQQNKNIDSEMKDMKTDEQKEKLEYQPKPSLTN